MRSTKKGRPTGLPFLALGLARSQVRGPSEVDVAGSQFFSGLEFWDVRRVRLAENISSMSPVRPADLHLVVIQALSCTWCAPSEESIFRGTLLGCIRRSKNNSKCQYTRAMLSLIGLVAIATGPAELRQTTVQPMQNLRNSFVERAKSAGFKCSIPPPEIKLDEVTSFGEYNSAKNTVTVSEWDKIPREERGFFAMLAGKGASVDSARQTFETVVHKFVFVHELGHWTQVCRGWSSHKGHYTTELDANRVAVAYWREVDPSVLKVMTRCFEPFVASMPSPCPAGQDERKYFDANYRRLAPTPGFIWYQARMVLDTVKAKPAVSFKRALSH